MKSDRFLSSLQRLSLPARAGLLAGSLLLAAAVVSPIAFSARGQAGLLAGLFAALVCLVPGLIALGLGEVFRGPQFALFNLLFGMLLRMGVPLAVCVAVYAIGGPLVEGGMAFSLLAFYPVMLSVETMLLAARAEDDQSEAALSQPQGGA